MSLSKSEMNLFIPSVYLFRISHESKFRNKNRMAIPGYSTSIFSNNLTLSILRKNEPNIYSVYFLPKRMRAYLIAVIITVEQKETQKDAYKLRIYILHTSSTY